MVEQLRSKHATIAINGLRSAALATRLWRPPSIALNANDNLWIHVFFAVLGVLAQKAHLSSVSSGSSVRGRYVTDYNMIAHSDNRKFLDHAFGPVLSQLVLGHGHVEELVQLFGLPFVEQRDYAVRRS